MQSFNHISGGLAFTGIFASFTEVNIFEREEYIAATVVFSLLPDIDHTRSLIGKLVFPIAKWINTKFGHRTITHSLIFYILLTCITASIEQIFHNSNQFTIICIFASASHLIFDMCTKQGIQLFYPFSKRAAVLPGNPNLRLSGNNIISEVIIFIVFTSMVFFCQPLFANGFWTSYNKVFLTHEHITKEFVKSKDLIFVKFQAKDNQPDSGYLIKSSEGKMLFYRSSFTEIPTQGTRFDDFKHTGDILKFEQKRIFEAEPDSIKKHLDQPIIKLQIQSQNAKLNWYEGAIMKSGNELQTEYVKNFDFFTDTPDQDETKRQRLEMLRGQVNQKNQIRDLKIEEVKEIETWIDEANERYDKVSDHDKTRIIEDVRIWRQNLGRAREKHIQSTEPELREIRELERQLNQRATISANIIILKIQKHEVKRSGRKENNKSGISNYARR